MAVSIFCNNHWHYSMLRRPTSAVRHCSELTWCWNIEYWIHHKYCWGFFETTSSFFPTLPPNWIGMCSWKVKENGQNSFYLTRVRVQSFAEIGSGFTLWNFGVPWYTKLETNKAYETWNTELKLWLFYNALFAMTSMFWQETLDWK